MIENHKEEILNFVYSRKIYDIAQYSVSFIGNGDFDKFRFEAEKLLCKKLQCIKEKFSTNFRKQGISHHIILEENEIDKITFHLTSNNVGVDLMPFFRNMFQSIIDGGFNDGEKIYSIHIVNKNILDKLNTQIKNIGIIVAQTPVFNSVESNHIIEEPFADNIQTKYGSYLRINEQAHKILNKDIGIQH